MSIAKKKKSHDFKEEQGIQSVEEPSLNMELGDFKANTENTGEGENESKSGNTDLPDES